MAFCPASYALHSLTLQEDVEKNKYREKYLAIARDTAWLLQNGLKLEGCRSIARKYKELFRQRSLSIMAENF